jgi:signal transduction histidine kinase
LELGPDTSKLSHEALRRLIDVGSAVVAELDSEAVLERVLEAARELTGARYAALGVLDGSRRELERFVTSGIGEEGRRMIGDLPRGRGILGLLISDPTPLRLADVGSHPESYGFPAGHPPMSSFLGVPILIRGEAWGNLYLTEKTGGEFDEADEEAIIVLARWAATAIENARLYRAERSQRTDLQRAVRALETTRAITRALGSETDLARVLELIVKRGRALVEAKSMVILLAEGEDLAVAAAAGDVHHDVVGVRIPIADSVAGEALIAGRPERLSEVSSRLRFRLADQIDAQTGLFVPLIFRSRRLGVLAAFDRLSAGPEFDAEDERIMDAFAAAGATAVATAQDVAAQSLQRSIEASERERSRWARELHDDTLQELGGLKLALAAARRADDSDRVRASLGEMVEQVSTAIAQLRHLITDLRPASLDELGTQPALEALVERVAAVNGLEIDLHADLGYEQGRNAERHAAALETTIYRIVQEGLTNVAKHAGATRVEVSVVEDDRSVTIVVSDDGKGFDPEARAEGFGVVGMRERAALVGGSLVIDSAPGAGTRIRASLPVTATATPAADIRLAG